MSKFDTVDQNMFALKDIGSLAELLYNLGIAFDQVGIEQESFACCRKCGEQLTSVYMEEQIYMAVCPECKTVTLTKASYSIQALVRLGDWMGESKAEQLEPNDGIIDNFADIPGLIDPVDKTVIWGKTVKHLRDQKGVTVRSLANQSDTSSTSLYSWESGEIMPTIANYERVVKALGYDIVLRETSSSSRQEALGAARLRKEKKS